MIQLNTIEGFVLFIFATKQGTYVLSVHMKSVKPAKDLTACACKILLFKVVAN